MRQASPLRWLFIAIVILALPSGTAGAQEAGAAYSVKVDGLACPFCAYGIEKRLGAVDNVAAVEIDLASGTVTVVMRPGATLDRETAREAVAAAGFTMRNFSVKRRGQ